MKRAPAPVVLKLFGAGGPPPARAADLTADERAVLVCWRCARDEGGRVEDAARALLGITPGRSAPVRRG